MRIWKYAVVFALAAFSCGAAMAQSPVGADRLFLSFAEDASIANRQWWEGQIEYSDGSDDLPWDRTILRGVFAINPIKNLEIGGRVGFGSTSAPDDIPDGSGATDLEAWGKWSFGNYQNTAFAAGGLVTVPTGDETSGLGTDAFSLKAFGSLRHKLPNATFTANVGVRLNNDGSLGPGNDIDGKTSASLGLGLILPLSQQLSFVGEMALETARFEDLDSDTRILAGVNWSPAKRGIFRGALGFGLTDGSPDFTLLAGYAYTF
jgi:hypothetical protein